MTMTCYACDPHNPDRVFAPRGDGWHATFAAHFNGPPRSVNGGVAIGALACPAIALAHASGAEHPAAVRMNGRLRRPVPVETLLHATAETSGDGRIDLNVQHEGTPLITGTAEVARMPRTPAPGDVLQPPPAHLVSDLLEMGGLRDDASRPLAVPDEHHPIPNCFSCGPANQRGLRIRPRVAGARDVWAAWHPDPRYTGPDGVLPLEVTGAALDCSNAMALSVAYPELGGMRELVPILAAFDMHVLRAPPAAPTGGYRVVARATGVDGRKYHSLSALFAAEGTPYAVADTTWVALPKSDVGYKG